MSVGSAGRTASVRTLFSNDLHALRRGPHQCPDRSCDHVTLSRPHHTISDVGLIDGGPVPLPVEVSQAYHGLVFVDERLDFKGHALKGLV